MSRITILLTSKNILFLYVKIEGNVVLVINQKKEELNETLTSYKNSWIVSANSSKIALKINQYSISPKFFICILVFDVIK